MTSVKKSLEGAVGALTAAEVETPRLDAELLLAEAVGVGREALYREPERELPGAVEQHFAELVRRRAAREPVAYISGRAHFRRLTLHVDRHVLIPRPETELLVEFVREMGGARPRVLDVGTGSGAVALAIVDECPGAAVVATDSSPGGLDVARANAARLGLEVEFVETDLVHGTGYDVVVSNPPYVREDEWPRLQPEITGYEPRAALVAGADGLVVIRRLVPAAFEALEPGGLLGVEVGAGQADAVVELVRAACFTDVGTTRDLAKIERVVWARR